MSKSEGKEDKETFVPDMKIMYDAFTSQFKKMFSKLDELDEWRKEMTETVEGISTRNRRRRNRQSNLEQEMSGEEFDEDSSVVNRRADVRNNRGRHDSNLSAIKMKIPEFKGRNDAETYLEWERKVEMVFACHNYSEEKKVKLAAVEFSDYALVWWDELLKSRRRNGEYPIDSWAEMT